MSHSFIGSSRAAVAAGSHQVTPHSEYEGLMCLHLEVKSLTWWVAREQPLSVEHEQASIEAADQRLGPIRSESAGKTPKTGGITEVCQQLATAGVEECCTPVATRYFRSPQLRCQVTTMPGPPPRHPDPILDHRWCRPA